MFVNPELTPLATWPIEQEGIVKPHHGGKNHLSVPGRKTNIFGDMDGCQQGNTGRRPSVIQNRVQKSSDCCCCAEYATLRGTVN
jgi:hypothetical protein